MARVIIETTPEEQDKVLEVLKKVEGQTIPVAKIAEMADMHKSRVRYVIMDLLEAKKIERVVSKAFNEYYIRYSYKIL